MCQHTYLSQLVQTALVHTNFQRLQKYRGGGGGGGGCLRNERKSKLEPYRQDVVSGFDVLNQRKWRQFIKGLRYEYRLLQFIFYKLTWPTN